MKCKNIEGQGDPGSAFRCEFDFLSKHHFDKK